MAEQIVRQSSPVFCRAIQNSRLAGQIAQRLGQAHLLTAAMDSFTISLRLQVGQCFQQIRQNQRPCGDSAEPAACQVFGMVGCRACSLGPLGEQKISVRAELGYPAQQIPEAQDR